MKKMKIRRNSVSKMSSHLIVKFVYFLLCFFILVSAANAESTPVPDQETDSVSETEEPAIEEDFWISGDYTLSAYLDSSDNLCVEIFKDNLETGDHVIWMFQCDNNSEPDYLLSHTCTVIESNYDDNNLLVQNISPDLAWETSFVLDEKDQVTVFGASDDRVNGRIFSRLDDSTVQNGEFFSLEEEQQWWLESMPPKSWEMFRPVTVEGRQWFWIYKMPGNVYALYEPYQEESVISYLILGEESALLWDTGMGISNIRECVEQLTDLPITVLNSHVHFDHTGGDYLFENVMCYNIPSAIRILTEGMTHLDLEENMNPKLIVNLPPDFDKENFSRVGKVPTATVEDGQMIDLGGRMLEVLYTPGHSESCIMLIDEANSILFTGDTWYPGGLYAFMEDSSLPDYAASMHRAEDAVRENNISWIFPSHDEVIPGTDLFFETADFLQDVLDGKIEYYIDEDLKCYPMNSTISLYMALDETEEDEEDTENEETGDATEDGSMSSDGERIFRRSRTNVLLWEKR